ncbi:MAG: type II toxin-antitoxin system Phd/YefM family antitoxin [Caulobacter sp.]|nr:type II toxin-antitoxin system Phd/YefM family antitoxin [Caulobacter sp.]
MKQVTISELRRNLARYLDEAMATGEPLIINRKRGRLVLRSEPATFEGPSRADRMKAYFAAGSDLVPEALTIEEARALTLAYSMPSDFPRAAD